MGVELPVPPGVMKGTVPGPRPWSLVANFTTEFLFNLLYTPTAWAEHCNNEVYQLIGLIHQTALARNVTLDGSLKINVPSGEFTFDKSGLGKSGAALGPLTSYSPAAIAGADNFNDDSATISDVFDSIVENTRDITPTCEFFPSSAHTHLHYQHVSNQVGTVWTIGYVQEQSFSEDAF